MDNKNNRPKAREKNINTGDSAGVHRRGEKIGNQQVGTDSQAGKKPANKTAKRASIGGGSLLVIILAVLFTNLFGGGGGTDTSDNTDYDDTSISESSSGGNVNNSVASGSRDKYTSMLGNNQDTVTIMVYMCGTDLESKYGMASSDMQEMAAADLGDNVNIIVFTGGCKQWKTNGISNKNNQIFRIKNHGLELLENNMGSKAMTDPNNLTDFIKYCNKNYPANRNELILWDHGGGSVSGYGYDEKNKSGSMELEEIAQALKNSEVKFDFVGFDACLMATAETALMLDDYADYMIASEETEPGIGWYYTEWLNKLGKNTSMPTVELGKNIIDGFITTCAKKCRGQKTTLSIIDLAEFSNTVPSKLTAWADSVSKLISDKQYQKISDARYNAREFAQSSKIDQIDLINFAENTDNLEGHELSTALRGAIKYNRTSSNMTNAYGVSIYFPYQRTSYVDSACNTYNQIGMDSSYSNCIRSFAKLETSGQITAGGTSSSAGSLFGSSSSSGSSFDTGVLTSLLDAFLGGGDRSIEGLDGSNTDFMKDSSVSNSDIADFISLNHFDPSNLVWEKDGDEYKISLPDDQWNLVHSVDASVFYDDGTGYIDLGLNDTYTFDDDGKLVADLSRYRIAINNQPVAYYHTDTTEKDDGSYTITGYVPAFLNGEKVKIILVFDSENPKGYIAGAQPDYISDETQTVAKAMTELNAGDKIDFVCDYYTYDEEFEGNYYLGEQMTVTDNMEISDYYVGDDDMKIMYRFTDIYNQNYWTEALMAE
ncbi:MAG: peptidase C11 [Ruminococcus sp.]|nr:peptidase C11 [Ruminococcus sp.]